VAHEDALKRAGVDEIIVFCVNDGAVMQAWCQDQGVPEDSVIKFMADPYGELTAKLDMQLTHAGPLEKGLVNRCKRHALYVVDGKIKIKRVAESPTDPAGDEFPDVTLAEAMLRAIQELQQQKEKEEL
jgi:peroxiredoxin